MIILASQTQRRCVSKLVFFWQPDLQGQAPASVGREMTLWRFCFAAAAGGLTTVGAWPEQLCECAGTMEVLGVLRHQCKTTNNWLLNCSPRQRLQRAAELPARPGITNTSSRRYLERVAELLQKTKAQAKHSLYLESTELPRITDQGEQAQITQRAQWGSPWDAISQSKRAKLRAKKSQRKVCQLMLGMLPYS